MVSSLLSTQTSPSLRTTSPKSGAKTLLKLYLVKFEKCDYDEYDAFVIAADNELRAAEVMLLKMEYGLPKKKPDSVVEIGTTELSEGIVLGSFNAG